MKDKHVGIVLTVTGAACSMEIQSASNRLTIPCEPAETDDRFSGSFPAEFCHQVAAGDLRTAIEKTAFCCDTEPTRYALGGILFHPQTSGFVLASTDSRRLSFRELPAEVFGTLPDGFDNHKAAGHTVSSAFCTMLTDCLKRIPADSPVSIASALIVSGDYADNGRSLVAGESRYEDENGELRIRQTRREIVIESPESFSLRALPIEGRFPRYRDVVPRYFPIEVTVYRPEFIAAIQSAAVCTDEESRGLDFVFRPDGCGEIHGQAVDIGKSNSAFHHTAIDVETIQTAINRQRESRKLQPIECDSMSITFDPKYLLDFLKRASTDNITLGLTDSDTAAVMRDQDDSAGTFVIMPLAQDR